MKPILLTLFLACSQALALDAQQLIESAAAVVSMENGTKGLSRKEEDGVILYVAYMRGFLAGVNTSSAIDLTNDREAEKVTFPPPWMWESKKTAPSLVAFIRSNAPEDVKLKDVEGWAFVSAWYSKEHPDSPPFMKAEGYKIVLNIGLEKAKEAAASAPDPDYEKKMKEAEKDH